MHYIIFQVETIGDAYMVASGVPVENDYHATEVSRMALDLLENIGSFKVLHNSCLIRLKD